MLAWRRNHDKGDKASWTFLSQKNKSLSAKLAGIVSPDEYLLSTLCQNIGNHTPADVGETEVASAELER